MDNIKLMNVFDSSNNLLEEFACLIFLEPSISNYIVEELTSTCILHNEVQLFWGLDNFIKLYDVWVANKLENVDFSGYSFYI